MKRAMMMVATRAMVTRVAGLAEEGMVEKGDKGTS